MVDDSVCADDTHITADGDNPFSMKPNYKEGFEAFSSVGRASGVQPAADGRQVGDREDGDWKGITNPFHLSDDANTHHHELAFKSRESNVRARAPNPHLFVAIAIEGARCGAKFGTFSKGGRLIARHIDDNKGLASVEVPNLLPASLNAQIEEEREKKHILCLLHRRLNFL